MQLHIFSRIIGMEEPQLKPQTSLDRCSTWQVLLLSHTPTLISQVRRGSHYPPLQAVTVGPAQKRCLELGAPSPGC